MSNDSTVWNILPENSTEVPPGAVAQQDSYVLLLVILSIFLVGTLIFIFVLLIACRHCFQDGRRYARASDDPEKTNTTYMEETQPMHEITIRVDESDCLSMASSHDQETERFLSVGTMGRRVSFNEAALFDHSKKAQEKGRRYTLTEGDFHHLKNARLTHLHIPPPALKIVTIPECDSAENTITMATRPATKSALSIFQPMLCPLPQTALTSLSISPSSALPGDALNSVVDTSFSVSPSALSTKETSSSLLRPRIDLSNLLTHSLHEMEMMGAGPRGRVSPSSLSVCEGASVVSGVPPGGGPEGSKGPVMQFFNKLRRHASLEGASPYFKIKKWKLDSSQRASSLDTRGSPKRRQFQRQRAASESMEQDDKDTHHIDLIQYIARTQDITYCPGRPTSRLLSPPSTPPPSLGRLEVEVTVEPSCSHSGPGVIGLSPEPQDEAPTLAAGDAAEPPEPPDTQDTQALYRDIWMLRASLEQCATSDNSSNNDRSSVCSDVDSVCSLGTRGDGERTDGPPSHLSQDAADEAEGGGEGWGKRPGRGSMDSETGGRKLLQMDSGYASIEAPWPRGPDEPKDRTATEKRRHFTSAGHTGTVGDSLESHLSEEEPELEERASGWSSPYGQMFTAGEAAQLPPPPPPSPHRRDYSIDEKTDALFHQFLRHDPRFDLQESPLKKHRSRVHLRKQWQRQKQWSDPGVPRRHASFERQRTPLRRGDSVNCPLDASYHAALPHIVSAPNDEAAAGSLPENGAQQQPVTEREGGSRDESRQHRLPPDEYSPVQHSGYGPQTITAELTDKLTSNLDDRLYTGLRRARDVPGECVTVTVTHASPDHSPV